MRHVSVCAYNVCVFVRVHLQELFSVMEASSDKEKIIGSRILYTLASSLAVHNMVFLKGKVCV